MSGSFRSAETIDDDVKEEKMKLMSDSHTSPFAVVVKVTSSPRAHSIYSFHFFFLNLLNVTAGFIPSRLLPYNSLVCVYLREFPSSLSPLFQSES